MTPTSTEAPTRSARVRYELVSALLFIPLFVGSFFALVRLRAWAEWANALAWSRARATDHALPPEPPRRRQRPVALLATVLVGHLASYTAVMVLVCGGLGLATAPLITRLSPGTLVLAGWYPTAQQSWVLVVPGLTLTALSVPTLAAIGTLRFQLMRELADAENEELTAQVRRLSESRATLVDAFEAERRRIERDLHDGTQQRLVGLAMMLGIVNQQVRGLVRHDPRLASVFDALATCQNEAEAALAELRLTVRGIHPQVLSDHGLFAALRELAARPGLDVVLQLSGDDALVSSPVAAACWFGVSEAVTNAGKHAGVQEVEVRVRVHENLVAEITDTGTGGARLDHPNATGLRGLAERMAALGGTLVLFSPLGEGTRVVMTLPLVPTWNEDETR